MTAERDVHFGIRGRTTRNEAPIIVSSTMKVFRSQEHPFRAADAASFVGSAETKLLASAAEGTPVNVYHVCFADGARTNWHTHSGAQWLIVTEGSIRVQSEGQAPLDVAVGDAVLFAANEKHWHGSVPGQTGAHVAVNIDVQTTWLEPVSDDEYGVRR